MLTRMPPDNEPEAHLFPIAIGVLCLLLAGLILR